MRIMNLFISSWCVWHNQSQDTNLCKGLLPTSMAKLKNIVQPHSLVLKHFCHLRKKSRSQHSLLIISRSPPRSLRQALIYSLSLDLPVLHNPYKCNHAIRGPLRPLSLSLIFVKFICVVACISTSHFSIAK